MAQTAALWALSALLAAATLSAGLTCTDLCAQSAGSSTAAKGHSGVRRCVSRCDRDDDYCVRLCGATHDQLLAKGRSGRLLKRMYSRCVAETCGADDDYEEDTVVAADFRRVKQPEEKFLPLIVGGIGAAIAGGAAVLGGAATGGLAGMMSGPYSSHGGMIDRHLDGFSGNTVSLGGPSQPVHGPPPNMDAIRAGLHLGPGPQLGPATPVEDNAGANSGSSSSGGNSGSQAEVPSNQNPGGQPGTDNQKPNSQTGEGATNASGQGSDHTAGRPNNANDPDYDDWEDAIANGRGNDDSRGALTNNDNPRKPSGGNGGSQAQVPSNQNPGSNPGTNQPEKPSTGGTGASDAAGGHGNTNGQPNNANDPDYDDWEDAIANGRGNDDSRGAVTNNDNPRKPSGGNGGSQAQVPSNQNPGSNPGTNQPEKPSTGGTGASDAAGGHGNINGQPNGANDPDYDDWADAIANGRGDDNSRDAEYNANRGSSSGGNGGSQAQVPNSKRQYDDDLQRYNRFSGSRAKAYARSHHVKSEDYDTAKRYYSGHTRRKEYRAKYAGEQGRRLRFSDMLETSVKGRDDDY